MDTPGCFLNPQWRHKGKSVYSIPVYLRMSLLGLAHLTGCQCIPTTGPVLLATKYVLHFNIKIITLFMIKIENFVTQRSWKRAQKSIITKAKAHFKESTIKKNVLLSCNTVQAEGKFNSYDSQNFKKNT